MDVKIEESWKRVLAPEFEKPYFQNLVQQLHAEKRAGRTIYPPGPLIFNAFALTPFDKVKVVILGQDPYHGPGQAEGLSFSVPHGVPLRSCASACQPMRLFSKVIRMTAERIESMRKGQTAEP